MVDACPAGEQALPVRLAALLLSLGEDGTRRTLSACAAPMPVLRKRRCWCGKPEGVTVAFSSDTSTGCGTQRMLRALSSTRILLAAVPTATSCFRHWRRSLLLQAIPSPAIALATGSHPSRTVLRETTVTPDFTIYARRLLGKYNLCTVQRIAALGTALQPERAADFAALSELAEQLDADGVCCRVSQLAVNGRDLMAAGVPAGPGIRKVLEALLDGVIREEYPNERQALLAAVQQLAAS